MKNKATKEFTFHCQTAKKKNKKNQVNRSNHRRVEESAKNDVLNE